MPPVSLRSARFALVYPVFSAALVGFVAAQSYQMSGHVRADVMGVTSGLMVFLMERAAWWLGVCFLDRENQPTYAPAPVLNSGRAIHRELQHLRQEERTYAAQIDDPPRWENKYCYENAGQLWVSQHPQGGPPWMSLPVDVTRQHINYFARVCIEPGNLAPTESNLSELPRDVIIALREFSLRPRARMWAVEKPGGRFGTWELTETGKAKWQQVQWRLLGVAWNTTPPSRAGVQNGAGASK